MIILISPAKNLNFDECELDSHTSPRMLDDSQVLVDVLKKKSVRSLKKLMSVSDKIATLNYERFQEYETPFTPQNAKQAVLTFNGDVYTGLQADTFEKEELDFAQQHLRILSGLYGLLKPLDLMQPYRLEMGTSLKVRRKKNLYDFWGSKITDMINADLKESGGDTILNLASQEYFRSVQANLLKGQLVTVNFKENRNGQYKVISFNAKKARGNMARQIIRNKVTDVNGLLPLDVDGYRYNETLSGEGNLMFTK